MKSARLPLSILLLSVLAGFLTAHAAESRPAPRLESFTLADQFGTNHSVSFPRTRPVLLLVGDRRGSEEIDAWIPPLKARWTNSADIAGIGDVSGAPRFLRNRITEGIRRERPRPLMLDFDGKVTAPLQCASRTANVLVVGPDGTILARITGLPGPEKLARIESALQPVTAPTPTAIPTHSGH